MNLLILQNQLQLVYLVLFQTQATFLSVILKILDHEIIIVVKPLGLYRYAAMSAGFNSPGIYLWLILSTFFLTFLTLLFTQAFQFSSTHLIHYKATDVWVQQTVFITFDSKRQGKSSNLGTEKPLLDTTINLAITNLTVILSLNIVLIRSQLNKPF